MPAIRVERVPVRTFGLGILGFDHLQLVYQPSSETSSDGQENWLVIEGLREVGRDGLRLGVEGWDGGTTLADANGGASGAELVGKIGTAETRGGREIVAGREAPAAWAMLASFAFDMEAQRFPYIAYALPGSPLPTINSSSLVASLLYHAGYDLSQSMPYGTRLSPGTGTLLGTSEADRITLEGGPFTAVVSGGGADELYGTEAQARIDKLYGGRGSDVIHWSDGFNIIHGGQPYLAYAEDGTDTVDYSGAGEVRIEAAPAPIEHLRPDFIVTHERLSAVGGGAKPTDVGIDQLLSIEDLRWDDRDDKVTLGPGVGLIRAPLSLDLGGGNDVLDGREAGFEVRVAAGGGDDLIIAGSQAMIAAGGDGADRFVVARAGALLTIEDASSADRLLVDCEFAQVRSERAQDGDLLIHIIAAGDDEQPSLINVRHFKPGDLGLEPGTDGEIAVSTLRGDALPSAAGAFDYADMVEDQAMVHNAALDWTHMVGRAAAGDIADGRLWQPFDIMEMRGVGAADEAAMHETFAVPVDGLVAGFEETRHD